MRTALKLFAPYLAVIIFWLLFKNAWLSILAYHAQILFWSRGQFKTLLKGFSQQGFLRFAIPCALTGLAAYFLLPFMYPVGALEIWLSTYKLEGILLVLMLPYFGLIHPPLEQLHWAPLRKKQGFLTHACFAGYHAIVLISLLNTIWLVLAIAVLFTMSLLWHQMHKTYEGLAIPALTHSLADFGIIIAAYLLL